MEWKQVSLQEQCTIFQDGNWIESKDQSPQGFRLIQTGNIGFGNYKDKPKHSRYVSEETFKRLKCTEIFPGDVLISRLPDPIGRSCLIPDINFRMITAVDCTIVRFAPSKLEPKFFIYYTQSQKYLNEINKESSGTTRKRISRSKLGKILIPLPRLEEQQRIVDILDQSFATIDQAIANTKKNLQNAKELFQAYLESVFTNSNNIWEPSNLESITSKIGSGATPLGGKDTYLSNGISLIRSMNVYDEGFRKNNLAFINQEQATKLKNVIIEKNDVLLNITGASILRCCIAPDDVLPARVNQHVSIIRPIKTEIDFRFLHYLLISNTNKSKLLLIAKKGGSTREALTKEIIGKFKILFPKKISEQQEIADTLDSLLFETQNLEANYQQKLSALAELKQSILQKAFSGEL